MPDLIGHNDEGGGHGGDLAAALSLWNPKAGRFIDFSSNINPLGPPDGLLDHLSAALPEIVAYPEPQARKLRSGLAGFLGVAEERLLAGNGANELIHLLLLWHRPGRVLVPAPSFSEYERAARLCGAAVEWFSLLPGQEADFMDLGSRLNRGDLLIICNPNNPTGKLYSRRDLLALSGAAGARGATMLVDESFMLLTGRDEESLRDEPADHLWVVISLTKIWSLPGLRLGCAIGPQIAIGELRQWGDPWRVNLLAQKAGLYCIGQQAYRQETLDLVAREREFLTVELRETGSFEVFDGAANFLLIRSLDPAFRVADLQADLARDGLLIRRADNFPGLDQRYFRIAVRRRPENRELIGAINNWLKAAERFKGKTQT